MTTGHMSGPGRNATLLRRRTSVRRLKLGYLNRPYDGSFQPSSPWGQCVSQTSFDLPQPYVLPKHRVGFQHFEEDIGP